MTRPFASYVLLGSTLVAAAGTPALADRDDGDLLVISQSNM